MPRKLKDMSGERIGMLTVLRRAENRNKSVYWLCRCDCGEEKEMAASSLRDGLTRSCGCHRKRVSATLCQSLNLSHGKSQTPLYRVWANMNYRCNNPSAKAYPHYGGRGITVCCEWQDFNAFHKWAMSSGYRPGLSIDREDNDGDYSPDNCRWANAVEQGNNRRNCRHMEFRGQRKTLAEWAREIGVSRSTLASRIRAGLDVEQVLKEAA